ncbi:MAG: quercetin 2,3-dioxygenase [Chloroflexi bacterium]|nr:quercetin 2,3-dioxygenase [Chloroflexota bacterium]
MTRTSALVSVDRSCLDRSRWYSGYLLTMLVTGEETGRRFSLVEEVGRKGLSADPPMHLHTREDESFYVLAGEVTFFVGNEVIQATAGSFVFLPRGVPHRFALASDHVRMLNLCSPAGFEGFFEALSVPAAAMTLPPPPDGPPDIGHLLATAAAYGVTILGSPPAAEG